MTRPEIIAEAAHHLIDFHHPLRIYLFGSEARNESTPDSDLDFLVVLPDNTPEQVFKNGAIYTYLSGLGLAKDVVPLRISDFDRRAAHVNASLPAIVLREGKLLRSAGPCPVNAQSARAVAENNPAVVSGPSYHSPASKLSIPPSI